MIEVKLYSRRDCHLCEQTLEDLAGLQKEVPHKLSIIDVDSNPKLQKHYGEILPVVEVGPYRMQVPFTFQELQITLKAAELSNRQNDAITDALEKGDLPFEDNWKRSDRFSYWISRHYLAVFNFLIVIYLGFAFLAPVLQKIGANGPANIIYKGYGFLCHQIAYRSWFLFGEQSAYPTASAGMPGWQTYEEYTGFSPDTSTGLWDARDFHGNAIMGYKVALCERDVAIYTAMLVFGLVFAFLRKATPSIKSLPWFIWVFIGMVPIGLDGGSQLISQFFPQVQNIIPYRESTPFLRSLTGALFGLTTAWFGYPYFDESMSEMRVYLERRLARLIKK